MAPKRKFALSQNPLRSRASTSSSDPTPSAIRFRDEDAQKDFSENFSRLGVHSKCRVNLVDFCDAPIWLIVWDVWMCDESHIEYLLGWTVLY